LQNRTAKRRVAGQRMPSTPTSKSQVQAYKFVLRRMQSALVRRDAVMLHDPMRTHSRATIIGVVIGVVGLAGAGVFGLISPSPQVPNSQGIVVSQQSGSVYVLLKRKNGSKELIPTFNLASARLILAAQSQQSSGTGGQGANPSGGSSTPQVATAQAVDDSQLQGIAVGRLTGIPDGPSLLPSDPKQQVKGNWAVCDDIARNETLPDPTSEGKVSTTVLAGVRDLGKALPAGQSLLVKSPEGKTYLIYRTPTNANQPQAEAVRAQLDLTTPAVRSTFNPNNLPPRPITNGLLNAIPSVQPLAVPKVAGANTQSRFNLGVNTGGVVQVHPPGQTAEFYLVLADGLQTVSQSVANLVQSYNSQGNTQVTLVRQDQIASIPPQPDEVDVSNFPGAVPQVLKPENYPTVCLGWSPNTSDPKKPSQHTVITIGTRVPVPQGLSSVAIGQPNADGQLVNHFFMPAGHAAVVRSAQSAADFNRGPMFLVSDRGIKYGIPDTKTLGELGLSEVDPAPDAIVRLLPSGAQLDTGSATRTFDTVPVPASAGRYPSTGAKPQAAPSGN
ncbi:MAG: type VII secretion protein EccB, partial [Sciscionella sp.]